jgi:hypothetical protein
MLLVPIGAAVGARVLAPSAPAPSIATASQPATATPLPSADDPAPAVRGHILDANGDPVAGATVHVVSVSQPPAVLTETMSDASGAFVVTHVAGHLRVDAEHDPQGAVRSAELNVADGGGADVTLVLAPAAITGTVVDASDRLVAGAALSVEGVPWEVPGTTSDPNGGFRMPAVPFEATTVVAVATGYKTARVTLAPREDQPEPVLRVQLQAAPPVDGDVLDPDGKPARARVVACEGQASEARLTTGEDGVFRLPASAIGCTAIAFSDELAPSDGAQVVEGRRLVLRLGAGGGLDGVVVDERGMRLPSFTLGIESFVGAHGASARGMGSKGFEAGVFHWDGLAPGTYVLTAVASGKPPTRSDPVDVRGGAVTSGIRIVLAAGGVVAGHVYDDHHAALAGVTLHFDQVSTVVNSSASTTSDDTGAYHLEGAPSGPFTVLAQKDGFRVRMLSGLRVQSGATLQQDVTLTPAGGGASFELGGIGASLAARADGIVFVSTFPGDPADRAGLRGGDRILRIDGEDTTGMSVADALQRLRGEVGTSVGVTVKRADSDDPIDVVIVRATIAH